MALLKSLFRNKRYYRGELARYVANEYHPHDRAAQYERLLREANL